MAIDRRARRGGIAAISAGGLVAMALVGPVVWDGLWLALAPAVAVLMVAVRELHAAWRPGDGRLGTIASFVLVSGAGALLALMVIGLVVTATQGMEPAWLALPIEVAGYVFLVGVALFGSAALRARAAPRWAALLLAVGLPLGAAFDAATNLVSLGELFFFAGYGFYLGLGLFALSLIRLGVAALAMAKLSSESYDRARPVSRDSRSALPSTSKGSG
jgi:hypothetical protein